MTRMKTQAAKNMSIHCSSETELQAAYLYLLSFIAPFGVRQESSGLKEQLHNFVPDLLTLGEEGLTAASTVISILGKTILS